MNWTAFLIFVVTMAFTPGPNNLTSMSNAAVVGLRRAIPFNIGVFVSITVVMLVCAVFSSTLKTLIPQITFPVKIIGAGYMLYLAWKTIRHSSKTEFKKENITGFWDGFILQFVNAKVILYGFTTMSAYILPVYKNPAVIVCFALFLSFISFVSTLSWAIFGSLFNRFFSRYQRVINIVIVILLVYCAFSLFF
ncbi:amino acid transporter LysE [Spirochaetia bacterium]|nr:amino acid transporter LysE [Spirochaetia bacterium]GHU29928.1 amino acid transporter LysE [Spirochaetia bacterium]